MSRTTLPESSVVLTVYTILLGLIINSLVQALCGAVCWTRWNAVGVSAYSVSVLYHYDLKFSHASQTKKKTTFKIRQNSEENLSAISISVTQNFRNRKPKVVVQYATLGRSSILQVVRHIAGDDPL